MPIVDGVEITVELDPDVYRRKLYWTAAYLDGACWLLLVWNSIQLSRHVDTGWSFVVGLWGLIVIRRSLPIQETYHPSPRKMLLASVFWLVSVILLWPYMDQFRLQIGLAIAVGIFLWLANRHYRRIRSLDSLQDSNSVEPKV